jgi:hypothetical protein
VEKVQYKINSERYYEGAKAVNVTIHKVIGSQKTNNKALIFF